METKEQQPTKEGDWVLVPALVTSAEQQSCISIQVGVGVHAQDILVHGDTLRSLSGTPYPSQEEPCFSMVVEKEK